MIQAVTFWSPKRSPTTVERVTCSPSQKSHYSSIAELPGEPRNSRQENLPLSQSVEHFSKINLIAELLAQWHHNTILFHRPTCREAGKPRKSRHWRSWHVTGVNEFGSLNTCVEDSCQDVSKVGNLKLWAVYVLKIQNQVWWKGHCSGNLARIPQKKIINAPRGRDTFPVSMFRSTNPKDSRNPKLFSLFLDLWSAHSKWRFRPNKCVGSTGTPKKKVAFWAFQLFGKFCPPCWAPMTLKIKKKRESFLVQRRIFSPFWGLLLQEHCHQL